MVRHVRAPRSQSVSAKIKQWGLELGFQQVGITDTDLSESEPKLQAWLDKQYHGEMDWMARHGMLRARPHELLPGTLRVISVRMNYLPANAAFASTLKTPNSAMLAVMRWAVTITNFCATDSKAGRDDSATLCFAEF